MRKVYLIIAFLVFCTKAYAGIGVCHDGSGNILAIEKTGNFQSYQGVNCEYITDAVKHDRIINLLKTVPRKYIKWTTEPVEMIQAEKDAVDSAEAQAQLDADRARADKLEFTMEDVITALVKRINTRIPSNPITKQEIIDQLKSDKGL